MVVVRANNDAAALADELPGGAGASLQAFFDHAGLEAAGGGGADGEEEELEWLSNKDAFPSLETMAAGAVAAPARAAVGPRTKGVRRRRRVMAWNFPLALPQPPEAAAQPRRRCRHCEAEETPQWRAGPEGPRTLCNACGVRYKTGRLVPEYRPANSPTFSPEMHSNSHRRILEMRRRKEAASATGGTARSRRAARNAGEK